MLPKKERFTRKEFDACYRSRDRRSGKLMRLTLIDSTHPKASVVVSKKVSKSAVKRNHLRRQLYEIIQQTPRTRSTIVVLSGDAAKASFEALKKEFESLALP
jgi:ribonuclease P protein component